MVKKDEKLSGKAIAVLNMMRILPFLIQDFINGHENCLLKFILKAGIMLEIILLPTFTEGDILALQDVITDYFILRSLCLVEYPGFFWTLKPKHHYIAHIPELIRRFGPPRLTWTARYESKHRVAVNIMESAKSIKNTPYTIALRMQLRFGSCLYAGLYNPSGILYESPISKGIGNQDITASVTVHGLRYQAGKFKTC